jgi:hypothetical protein
MEMAVGVIQVVASLSRLLDAAGRRYLELYSANLCFAEDLACPEKFNATSIVDGESAYADDPKSRRRKAHILAHRSGRDTMLIANLW